MRLNEPETSVDQASGGPFWSAPLRWLERVFEPAFLRETDEDGRLRSDERFWLLLMASDSEGTWPAWQEPPRRQEYDDSRQL